MESEQDKKNDSIFDIVVLKVGNLQQRAKVVFSLLFIVALVSATLLFSLMPPFDFSDSKIVTIGKGMLLADVSTLLYEENIIRSKKLFVLCARVVGGDKPVVAGSYLFSKGISSCAVASRIAHGASGVPSVRITIPEGMSNQEIAEVLLKNLPNFSRNEFFETYNSQEGYLFPDTYFFPPSATTEDVVTKMHSNFDTKLTPLAQEIEASRHTLRDVIIMASILEKEATTVEDKVIVSGILWKRISIGMPLQVDATFMYLLGKKSSELTLGDLQMKSAYNTYQNRGLPYGPIGNPGIEAIRASIHPTLSPYLYYLSDDDGVMHYAKTFEEHKANKGKYLGNN